MGTDRGGDVDGSLGDDGTDHISGLPDHLLHSILRLPGGTADAARTSVLSRRWRRVWAHLPELLFLYKREEAPQSSSQDAPNRTGTALALAACSATLAELLSQLKASSAMRRPSRRRPTASTPEAPQASAPNRVDAALAAYSAPTVRRLDITMPYNSRHLTPEHVSSWLRFSSRHLAGELRLVVPRCHGKDDEEDILLPLCEWVTSIDFDLHSNTLRFRLPSAGAFKALATLRIKEAYLDSRELEDMLSCRCPCLKKLELESISLQGGAPILSLCSDSLEWLQIAIHIDGRLQVAAPKLRTFHGRSIPCEFYMAAPMLSEVCWRNNSTNYSNDYDLSRHRFAVAGRHLRRLEVDANSSGLKLMRQFNAVDELDLTVNVPKGIQEYKRFLEDTNKLARCEVLVVRFWNMEHSFKSAMLHLLRHCARVRKLVVQMTSNMDDYPCKLPSECPCTLLENRKPKNIMLGLLEEVEVEDRGETHNTVELVRFLCKCSKSQKKVAITVSEGTQIKYINMKVRNIVSPNIKVEIIVRRPRAHHIRKQ